MASTRKTKIMRLAGVLVTLGAAGAAFGLYLHRSDTEAGAYRFVTVERGDIETVVSATGTLEPVTTVEVGTQVSGIINEILVDFNDTVNKGQVVARLDTTLLEIAVREARANLIRNQAELDKAERDFERFSKLAEEGITSGSDLDAATYSRNIASANLSGAQVNLDRAEQNLEYATITAPISGVVVERNVDVGQTVAASLSAPQLLLLAADLARMQIMVSVDESDIGLIEEGQTARFTIQAYPDDTFSGTVQQVRLQSTSQENVVNYGRVPPLAFIALWRSDCALDATFSIHRIASVSSWSIAMFAEGGTSPTSMYSEEAPDRTVTSSQQQSSSSGVHPSSSWMWPNL